MPLSEWVNLPLGYDMDHFVGCIGEILPQRYRLFIAVVIPVKCRYRYVTVHMPPDVCVN